MGKLKGPPKFTASAFQNIIETRGKGNVGSLGEYSTQQRQAYIPQYSTGSRTL